MKAHPRLHLLLAHLGGASWHQIRAFAAAFPSVSFDLCEIIAWTGAPGAPTADELGRLIRDIGPERVLFGTDFPWYEVDRTIDQLMDLPSPLRRGAARHTPGRMPSDGWASCWATPPRDGWKVAGAPVGRVTGVPGPAAPGRPAHGLIR